jgi:hypothetical protein
MTWKGFLGERGFAHTSAMTFRSNWNGGRNTLSYDSITRLKGRLSFSPQGEGKQVSSYAHPPFSIGLSRYPGRVHSLGRKALP